MVTKLIPGVAILFEIFALFKFYCKNCTHKSIFFPHLPNYTSEMRFELPWFRFWSLFTSAPIQEWCGCSWAAGSQGSLLSRAGSRRIETAPALVGAGWTGGGQRTSGDWGFGRQMGPAAAACSFAGSLGVSLGRQGPVLFYYDRFGPPPSTTPAVVNAGKSWLGLDVINALGPLGL
jgi:hypothetical protein